MSAAYLSSELSMDWAAEEAAAAAAAAARGDGDETKAARGGEEEEGRGGEGKHRNGERSLTAGASPLPPLPRH